MSQRRQILRHQHSVQVTLSHFLITLSRYISPNLNYHISHIYRLSKSDTALSTPHISQELRLFSLRSKYILPTFIKSAQSQFCHTPASQPSHNYPNLIFRDNEIVKETLRQICIRNNYDSHMLINYLWKMKMNISADIEKDKWNPANLEIYSWNTVGALKLNKDILKNCFNNSFRSIDKNGTPSSYNTYYPF